MNDPLGNGGHERPRVAEATLNDYAQEISASNQPRVMRQRAHMFLAMKEKRFAKRLIKRLLKSHATISAGNPDLAGEALYREVLLHTQLIDPELVDETLWQAEDSVDDWTTDSEQEMGFRQLAHFVVMSQYWAAGNVGTVVSFRDIVYSLIPADM